MFEPLKTCDEPMAAVITGDVMEQTAMVVIKARKDAAEVLARELTAVIVAAMERDDTHNGYIKER